MHPLSELAEKREKQARLSHKVGENVRNLRNMTDDDVRCYNLAQQCPPLRIMVKEGIHFEAVYSFAVEHYHDTQENVLDEKISGEHMLLWSGGCLAELIEKRRMTERQYRCCVKVADMMLSGECDHYHSTED